MSQEDHSFQRLVDNIRNGDDDAVKVIWDEYFPRLVQLAACRLNGEQARHAGEEDVALSVIKSMVVALRKGRMQQLEDHDGLWRLLATMTRRKVIDLIRYNRRRPLTLNEQSPSDPASVQGLSHLPDQDVPPDVAVAFDMECQRLINLLPDDKYREVAVLRFEGYTVQQIADKRGCHISTIERQLRIVRGHWERELAEDA